MRKVIGAAALLAIFACKDSTPGFVIEGNLRGDVPDSTMVFLKQINEQNQPVTIDTAYVQNGNFTFEGEAATPELHYLFMEDNKNYTALMLENGDITFNAAKDSLGLAEIKGTPQNEFFADYLEASRDISSQAQNIQKDLQEAQLSTEAGKEARVLALRDEMQELEEEYRNYEKDFIQKNPSALISALLLDRSVATGTLTSEEAQAMYDALTPDIKETKTAKKVADGLERLAGREVAEGKTAIGEKAPEFSGPNPNGETIALKDVLGKVTLVDFWAAWCRPCRAENPNIVAVYKKYHDKGFNVLGVSLDRTEAAWKKAIEDDGLEWNHISNLAYFEDAIAKMYNVNAIPAAFLLDENGVIIAKNLRGPALEEKVSEVLD